MSSTPSSPPPLGARPDWEHLARYFSGESAGAEHDRTSAWLAANPEDRAVLEGLNRLVANVDLPMPTGLDVEASLRKTKAAAHSQVRPIVRVSQPSRPWVAPWFRVAAVLTIATVGGLVWRALSDRSPAAVATPTVASWRAGIGKTDSITLDDGSQVVLAPQSELVLLEGFGGDRREVRLAGQAWFRVVHDDAKPFVVHTTAAVVRDIGTVFTVTEKTGGNGLVRVAVHEGAVMLHAAEQTQERAFTHCPEADGGVWVKLLHIVYEGSAF